MKNKPDKYCAWHPEKGWLGDEYLLGMRSDFDDALEELREAFETEFQEACDKIGMDRDFVPWIRAQGWEIRPVWLSTEPPVEWISVEDRLPDASGDYWVYRVASYCGMWHVDAPMTTRRYDADSRKWQTLAKVTHWRPLPEAPSEKKNKEIEG